MPEKLKDTLYSKDIITDVADVLYHTHPAFEKNHFLETVFTSEWDQLELKQRMRHITKSLKQHLPENYQKAITILMKSSPSINGFIAMSFPDFVELYGQSHWKLSMQALEIFTKSCSSEFAIRPFLDQTPKQTMEQMNKWASNKNEHVRRLASEGCRPRLPWAMALKKFKQDPTPIIPILEKLKDDLLRCHSDY